MSWECLVVLFLLFYPFRSGGEKQNYSAAFAILSKAVICDHRPLLRCASCSQPIKQSYAVVSLSDCENLETEMDSSLPFSRHPLLPESVAQVIGAIWGDITLKPVSAVCFLVEKRHPSAFRPSLIKKAEDDASHAWCKPQTLMSESAGRRHASSSCRACPLLICAAPGLLGGHLHLGRAQTLLHDPCCYIHTVNLREIGLKFKKSTWAVVCVNKEWSRGGFKARVDSCADWSKYISVLFDAGGWWTAEKVISVVCMCRTLTFSNHYTLDKL